MKFCNDLKIEEHFMGDSSFKTFEIRSGNELICQLHEDFVEPEYVPLIKGTANLFKYAPEMFEIIKYLSTERNPNIYIAMDMAMKIHQRLTTNPQEEI